MVENGIRRTMWLPNELDTKAEKVRKKLGLGRSGFYRHAIVELVKQFAIFEENKARCDMDYEEGAKTDF